MRTADIGQKQRPLTSDVMEVAERFSAGQQIISRVDGALVVVSMALKSGRTEDGIRMPDLLEAFASLIDMARRDLNKCAAILEDGEHECYDRPGGR